MNMRNGVIGFSFPRDFSVLLLPSTPYLRHHDDQRCPGVYINMIFGYGMEKYQV